MTKDLIRVGVVGVGRGQSFVEGATEAAGMKLVALCDIWEERLHDLAGQHHVAAYTDYESFLEHDMDAVILANYFHEHAPFAVKALEAGKHVMSETASNTTLAEGVALCRAVEETGRIYMLAENYPYTAFSQEMQRLYRTGEIGEVTYAEGEYNHPMDLEDVLRISPGLNHWRAWIPSTYYCTHALAPLVYITGTRPVKVNGLSIVNRDVDKKTVRIADPGSVILCRMDNGAVFRLFGLTLPGHSNWYRVHGTRGAMEITRGGGYFGPGQVRVWHEEWDRKPDEEAERVYTPDWPEHGDLARQAGHGGGDFWTNFHFANAVRSGTPPFLDVYRGVAMSSVGILAWKSALEDGRPFEVPDFSDEVARKPYEDDHWSPWPNHTGPGQPPPSILGTPEPSPESVAYARKVWKEIGYE
ncbi:MAG: Gfo/Idh/MocA family oxidoreductase [Gemmatimonadota bacterium]|nr:Gfo/Idh/MocA family oxidoreductase [Gemmatimonadota bacterium]MEE2995230.1 Gfo/Idh/MocA family oxidoreductase [Gemmatimonadota bacterium]